MKKLTKKEIPNELTNQLEFSEILSENLSNYKGEFSEVLNFAPKIYELLCKLLESPNISRKDRGAITSAIAYFILPRDIYPEEVFGVKGYIDDVYLCLHILKHIERVYEFEEILDQWSGSSKELKKLLDKDYSELDKKFNHRLKDMLDYVGLKLVFGQ